MTPGNSTRFSFRRTGRRYAASINLGRLRACRWGRHVHLGEGSFAERAQLSSELFAVGSANQLGIDHEGDGRVANASGSRSVASRVDSVLNRDTSFANQTSLGLVAPGRQLA